MQEIHLSPYLFLALAEICIILSIATVFFWLRSRGQVVPKGDAEDIKSKSYEQFLCDEIKQSVEMIDTVPLENEDAPDFASSDAFKFRKGFLELERDIQVHDRSSLVFHEMLEARLKELMGELPVSDEVGDVQESEGGDDTGYNKLKNIISNQNEAVTAVRVKLEEQGDSIENYEEIKVILDTYDDQSKDLDRCVEIMENAVTQLKPNDESQSVSSADAGHDEGSLLVIVNNQQATIDNLKTLIVQLPADENVKEMQTTLDTIEQTNRDLNGCIVVLEDDNSRLRKQLEKTKLESTEKQGAESETETIDGQPENDDDEKLQLQAKVEALESAIFAKDKAILDLEKKHSEIEHQLLEAISE